MKNGMKACITFVLIGVSAAGMFTGSHYWGWWLFAAAIIWFEG